ncbi:MAG: hypothetical protein COA57_06540 [Flavobacteriales bacterium]|nr:hypothetical protein [Bacteroidales bacterium AH-315-I05]PCJ86171.1 MAG: hypothetical protein COA57_06540 [Flavobacteriales bacterium]
MIGLLRYWLIATIVFIGMAEAAYSQEITTTTEKELVLYNRKKPKKTETVTIGDKISLKMKNGKKVKNATVKSITDSTLVLDTYERVKISAINIIKHKNISENTSEEAYSLMITGIVGAGIFAGLNFVPNNEYIFAVNAVVGGATAFAFGYGIMLISYGIIKGSIGYDLQKKWQAVVETRRVNKITIQGEREY